MAGYTVAGRSAAAAAGAPILDIRTSSTDRVRLREMGMTASAATAAQFGLVRPNALGTTNATLAPQPLDPADAAASALVGTGWSSAPTLAGTPIYLRRFMTPALVGAGVIWTFPRGDGEIIIPVSSSLILWNFGAAGNPAADFYVVVDE